MNDETFGTIDGYQITLYDKPVAPADTRTDEQKSLDAFSLNRALHVNPDAANDDDVIGAAALLKSDFARRAKLGTVQTDLLLGKGAEKDPRAVLRKMQDFYRSGDPRNLWTDERREAEDAAAKGVDALYALASKKAHTAWWRNIGDPLDRTADESMRRAGRDRPIDTDKFEALMGSGDPELDEETTQSLRGAQSILSRRRDLQKAADDAAARRNVSDDYIAAGQALSDFEREHADELAAASSLVGKWHSKADKALTGAQYLATIRAAQPDLMAAAVLSSGVLKSPVSAAILQNARDSRPGRGGVAESLDLSFSASDKAEWLSLPKEDREIITPILQAYVNPRDLGRVPVFGAVYEGFLEAGKAATNIGFQAAHTAESMLRRTVMDGANVQKWEEDWAELQEMRETATKKSENHWLPTDWAIGAMSQAPYMFGASLPRAGIALITAQAATDYISQVAREGGDVSSMDTVAEALGIGLATGISEKIEVDIFKGARRMTPLERIRVYDCLKASSIVGRMLGDTSGELTQEALQDALMGAAVAAKLDKDWVPAMAQGAWDAISEGYGDFLVLGMAGVGTQIVAQRHGAINGAQAERMSEFIAPVIKDILTAKASGQLAPLPDMEAWKANMGDISDKFLKAGGMRGGGVKFLEDLGFRHDAALSIGYAVESTRRAVLRTGSGKTISDFFGGKGMRTWKDVFTDFFGGAEVTPDGENAYTVRRTITNGNRSVETETRIELGKVETDYSIIEQRDETGAPTSQAQSLAASVVQGVMAQDPSSAMTEDDVLAMTGEELRQFLDAKALANPGTFRLTSGGATVDSDQLAALTGTIRFDPTLDPEAFLHEAGHAFLAYAEKAGILTDADFDALRSMFGDARTSGERINEEAFSDALRDAMAGRIRWTEQTLFERIRDAIVRLLDMGAELLHLRRDRQSAADKARDSVFEQVLSGNVRGIPMVAASQSEEASPPGAATATPSETPPSAPPAPAPEPNPSENPTGSEKPNSAETPARPRRAPTEWTAVTPDGSMRLSGDWVVVDASTLLASSDPGYDQALQPRDRSTLASDSQVHAIATELDPARLADSPTTDTGAPLVSADGMVLSGNGRTLAIRAAYASGLAGPYAEAVRARAAEMGLAVPDSMRAPVLVRRLSAETSREDLVRAAELSNRPQILSRNESETAEADAATLLSGGFLDLLQPGDNGELLGESNRAFMDAFINATGDQGLRTADGFPTEAAQKRVRRAVLAALFQDLPNRRDLIRAAVEDADELHVTRELAGLMRGAPAILRSAAARPAYDLRQEIGLALADYFDFRRQGGGDIDAYLSQGQLFDERPPEVAAVLREIGKRRDATSISDFLQDYARRAEAQAAEGQDTFAFFAPPTKLDLLAAASADTARTEAEQGILRLSFAGVTPAEDAAYMDAVRRGDMDTARRMVREAAARAMPDTKVVGEDGLPKVVYHGTPKYGFTVFRENAVGSTNDPGAYGRGYYFTEIKDDAEGYKKPGIAAAFENYYNSIVGDNSAASNRTTTAGIYEVFLNIRNPKIIRSREEGAAFRKEFRIFPEDNLTESEKEAIQKEVAKESERISEDDWAYDEEESRIEKARALKARIQSESLERLRQAYDGVIVIRDGVFKEIVAFQPAQIKSAAPVTYDDAGNVIPLSQRFNPQNSDIRYSIKRSDEFGGVWSARAEAAFNDGRYPRPANEAYFDATGKKAMFLHAVYAYNPDAPNTTEWHHFGYGMRRIRVDGPAAGNLGELMDFAIVNWMDDANAEQSILSRIRELAESADDLADADLPQEKAFVLKAFGRDNPESFDEDAARARFESAMRGITTSGQSRYSISGLYTGSAADYAQRVPVLDKDGNVTGYRIDNAPSLQHVGTGEGSQVYGWGLYASDQRGVAEGYAKTPGLEITRNGEIVKPWDDRIARLIQSHFTDRDPVQFALEHAKKAGFPQKDIERLERGDYKVIASHSNIYEQTFFTNRAPGDERHLLKWYEPVSDEQFKWVLDALENVGWKVIEDSDGANGGRMLTVSQTDKPQDGHILFTKSDTGGNLYGSLRKMLGSPRAASEFLASAGIDGVKYPVDSYGGKGVKDGDSAGWNYVSFRDDNIRVDHKWTDGVQRYSVTPNGVQKQAGVEYPDASAEIVRFSIGSKRREEYAGLLARKRPDLDADAVLKELDKFDDPKKEKIALHWIVRGGLALPEDAYKIDDALDVAAKAKVDPFAYKSPDELLLANKQFKPTARPIDPATVPELSDPRDEGDGIVSYLVQDDKQGQAAMRRIIDTHWGEDANPWCLLARDKYTEDWTNLYLSWFGMAYPNELQTADNFKKFADEFERRTGSKARAVLSDEERMQDAWYYWNHYSALPKRVAFKDGKLLAFMATDVLDNVRAQDEAAFVDGGRLAELYPDEFKEYEDALENDDETRENQPNFYEWLDHSEKYWDLVTDLELRNHAREQWWDRKDESHPDLDWARDDGARSRDSFTPIGAGLANESIFAGLLAADYVSGKNRGDETYERLRRALHVEDAGTLAEAKAYAREMAEVRRFGLAGRAEASIRDAAAQGGQGADAIFGDAPSPDWTAEDYARHYEQYAATRALADAALGGMQEGVHLGDAARKAIDQARRNLIREAQGIDYEETVRHGGIDIAATLLGIDPDKFGALPRRKTEDEEKDADAETERPGPGEPGGRPLTEEEAGQVEVEQLALDERARRLLDLFKGWRAERESERRKKERKRAEEERRRAQRAATDPDAGKKQSKSDEEIDEEDTPDFALFSVPLRLLKLCNIDTQNATEMAAFLRILVADYLVSRDSTLTHKTVFKRRPDNVSIYRKTMMRMMDELATKLVDPTKGALLRNIQKHIERIPEAAGVDTIERRTAAILRSIQMGAVRRTQGDLIRELQRDIHALGIKGRTLDKMERDAERKINGEREVMARYARKIVAMGPRAVATEADRLREIMDKRMADYSGADGRDSAFGDVVRDAPTAPPGVKVESDVVYHDAAEKLRLLQEYGALRFALPAEIVKKGNKLRLWLEKGREEHLAKFEAKAAENRAARDAIRAALASSGRSRRQRKGLLARFWEENGSVCFAQRVQILLADMPEGSAKAAAARALTRCMRLIAEGSQERSVLMRRYAREFEGAVAAAIKGRIDADGNEWTVKSYLAHLDEKIPDSLSRYLTRQGNYDDGTRDGDARLTWGQALNLLGYLEQTATYAENIKRHGRDGQAAAIRAAASEADLALLSQLRAVYAARRDALSVPVRDITGFPVYNPDPLYMPANMFIPGSERDGLDTRVRGAWNPLAAPLTPRRANSRDVDESVSIADAYNRSSKATADAIAFGVRGIDLRSILASGPVKEAIREAEGPDFARAFNAHLTDILTGGDPGESGGTSMEIMRHVNTLASYSFLAWNPTSMLKQMTSVPAWAPLLPGGFRDVLRYMRDFDADSFRELCDAPGFVQRYGLDGIGANRARAILADPTLNWAQKIAQCGMIGLQIGDSVPGFLVGTGLYKAKKQEYANAGESPELAAEHAARDTWALIEECQQSDLAQNLPELMRRNGVFGRSVLKFAASPLQQLSWEIHAWRIWKRTGNGDDLRRAIDTTVANHVIMPALLWVVTNVMGAALGDDPDDKESWRLRELLVMSVLGSFGRVFLVGALTDSGLRRLLGLRTYTNGAMPGTDLASGLIRHGVGAARFLIEADYDRAVGELVKTVGSVAPPVKMAAKAVENWGGED